LIQSVFKYMPARLEFFDNFLLRASHKQSLNDPFEVRPSYDFWADLCLSINYTRFGETKEEIIGYLQRQKEGSVWSELGMSIYTEHGIISFTEEKDNLLMWSHYADEHRGIVVEFDCLHPFFNSNLGDGENSSVGKLHRVMYRKSRLNKVNSHLMEPYFHKSNEWAYEKEHRLLLNLYLADINLIPLNQYHHYESQKYFDKTVVEQFTDSLLRVNKYNGASIVNEPSFMSMFEVPMQAIKSVTFGVNVCEKFKHEVISKLNCVTLQHISLYQAKIDQYDYRLQFEKNVSVLSGEDHALRLSRFLLKTKSRKNSSNLRASA
jgi:hypothetical protein